MDDHLVIAHVVALGELDDPIQDHRIAKELGLDELQMLVLCLFVRKDALDSHALAVIGMQLFREPDAHKRSYAPSECVDKPCTGNGIRSTSASRSILRSVKLSAPRASLMRWISGIISLPIAHVNRSIAQ